MEVVQQEEQLDEEPSVACTLRVAFEPVLLMEVKEYRPQRSHEYPGLQSPKASCVIFARLFAGRGRHQCQSNLQEMRAQE